MMQETLRSRESGDDCVRDFERAFAKKAGVPFAVALPSCRFGVYHYLKYLGPRAEADEEEVVVPAFTYPAMPAAVRAAGMKPVFVDSERDGYNIDSSAIRNRISPKTKALLVSHLFGTPCEMEQITEIARETGVKIIEDCAHAAGSSFNGRSVGSWGHVGFFSFGIGKNLSTFGGGMMVSSSKDLAEYFRSVTAALPGKRPLLVLREALGAWIKGVLTNPPGFSTVTFPLIRLMALRDVNWLDRLMTESMEDFSSGLTNARGYAGAQARLGMLRLSDLETVNLEQAKKASAFDESLAPALQLRGSRRSRLGEAVSYYVIRSAQRDRMRAELLAQGIDTKACDMANCCPGMQRAERLSKELFELPISRWLSRQELEYIARAVNEAYERTCG